MKFNIRRYSKMLADHNIYVIYSGPIWAGGIEGFADMLKKRLEFDDIPLSSSQCVFSIFIEQISNMLMYSAEKEIKNDSEGNLLKVSKGVFILGARGTEYFIQSENLVTNSNAEILKTRIDYLNTLDKKEQRQYHKECLRKGNGNPQSKGASLGLIEIARRSSSPIEYEFTPYNDELQYYSIYLTVQQ